MAFGRRGMGGMRAESRNARSAAHRRPNLPPAHMPAGKAVIILAALLAFLLQSCILHTHIHADPHGPAVSIGFNARYLAERPASTGPDDCPICREDAQAGHYLMPVAITVRTPQQLLFWYIATPSRKSGSSYSAHFWHSRAPPKPFQA